LTIAISRDVDKATPGVPSRSSAAGRSWARSVGAQRREFGDRNRLQRSLNGNSFARPAVKSLSLTEEI
jgi:hypothetical protein